MPFDANGNFSLVPGTIVADGMNVLPSQHNPPFQDVANGLSQAVVRDGRAPMTGPLNMNGNKITGVAAGDAPDDVVTNAAIAALGVAIGDGKWSLRDLSPNWLRRDGSLYDIADYPDLAALYPPLPDGVLWSSISHGMTGSINDIIPYSGGFVAGTTSGSDSLIYQSDDGQSWTFKGTIASFALERLATGSGIFVATDGNGKTAVSNDLQSWSTQSTFTTGASGLAFIDGVFVGTGVNGQIKTTEDGVTWTPRTSGVTGTLFFCRAVNGVLIAGGGGGALTTSSDLGVTWTVRTSGVSTLLADATFGGGRYVVVGSGGVIRTSTNLSSWDSATSGTPNDLSAAQYSSSGFLVMGASGVARISSAGTSWAASATGTSFTPRAITFDPNQQNRYLAAGSTVMLQGIRTLPTQFRVENDGPNEWVRAL